MSAFPSLEHDSSLLTCTSISDVVQPPEPPPSSRSASTEEELDGISKFVRRAEKALLQGEASLSTHDGETQKLGEAPFVGREAELRRLNDSIDKVLGRPSRSLTDPQEAASDTPPRVVTISGAAGTGKTRLAQQLRSKVIDEGGYFITGKFEHQGGAYSGLAVAIQQLVEQIISRDFDMGIQRRLEESVRPEDAAVLVEVFPALSEILSAEQDEMQESHKVQRAKRRRFLFQQFMRAVLSSKNYHDEDVDDGNIQASSSDQQHHLAFVLVLDDVQWLDRPSLELISALVRDNTLESFLLVSTNRPIQDDHLFVIETKRWLSQNMTVQSFQLENLDRASVNTIVSALLGSHRDESTRLLAEIVHRKTSGNPFFVIEFLKALVDHALLDYSYCDMQWKWDEQKVQSLVITSRPVDLLTKKLKRLPVDEQLTILVAACLGWSFDLALIESVVENVDGTKVLDNYTCKGSAMKTLERFVDLGFLNRSGDIFFFVHDIIKQAAMDFVPKDKSDLLRLQVGQCILEDIGRLDKGRTKTILFLGVDLCNGSSSLLATRELLSLAKYNLLAGEKAVLGSAFALAFRYMETGLRTLERRFSSSQIDTELYLDLLAGAAETSYCIGNFEEMSTYANRLLERTCSEHQRLKMLYFKVLSATARKEHKDAIEIGFTAIQLLGMASFPVDPTALYTWKEFFKTRRALCNHTEETLTSLPILVDEKRITAMKFIDAMLISAFKFNTNFLRVAFLKSMRWSLKYGVSKYSPLEFAVYGVLMTGFGDFEAGRRFGEVALSLSERIAVKETIAKTSVVVLSNIRAWTNEMRCCYSPMVYSHKLAMESGDTETALLCLWLMDVTAWCTSLLSLPALALDLQLHCSMAREYKHSEILSGLTRLGKGIRRLCSSDMTCFHWCDIDPTIGEPRRELDDILSLQSHFLLGEKDEALKYVQLLGDVGIKRGQTQPFVPRAHFYRGLAVLGFSDDLRQGKCVLTMMEKWAKSGNPNCKHMVFLLRAEVSRIRKQSDLAKQRYSDAIQLAHRTQHTHDAGIAHECAANFYLGINERSRAANHIEQAVNCFRDWGASAKVQQLCKKHDSLLAELGASTLSLRMPSIQKKEPSLRIKLF